MATNPIVVYLESLLEQHRANESGALADYIPELAKQEPESFAISMVTVEGAVYEVGDSRQRFTIQSISKPFTYALILDELGHQTVEGRIGVEPTGDAFNSISLDPVSGMPLNPMINAGAITAAGLVAESRSDGAEAALLSAYGKWAGRELAIDEDVYSSERDTAHRNRAIAHLLLGAGAIRVDPETALDLYLRQCSVLVDTRDLAVMAATLAKGGVNPLTTEVAASADSVARALTVMTTCGMYDAAGQWFYDVGLPAKSGVAGGILAVLPGRLGIAVFSPRLDDHGNSARGVAVCRQIARDLSLSLLRSSIDEMPPIRATSTHQGGAVLAIELQGHLDFTAVERCVRAVLDASPPPRYVVLDLSHITDVYQQTGRFRDSLAESLEQRGGRLVASGVSHLAHRLPDGAAMLQFGELQEALAWCEAESARG